MFCCCIYVRVKYKIGAKKVGPKNGGPKKVRAKKIKVQQNFESPKGESTTFWVQKVLDPKKFWSNKNFDP